MYICIAMQVCRSSLFLLQIGAALRPAFTPDTAPHVTAMACQVCSEWLGSGVSRHVGDLKRVQQLLVTSLDKLQKGRREKSLYGEIVATMESLAVLKAWAELYIKVSVDGIKRHATPEPEVGGGTESTEDLIEPHLLVLSKYWLSAISDHAHLSLPDQFSTQLPPGGGEFYTAGMASYVKPYYNTNWPSILEACSLWAGKDKFKDSASSNEVSVGDTLAPPFAGMLPLATGVAPPPDERHDTFYLLMGVAIQALCDPALYDTLHTIKCCLQSLHHLLATSLAQTILTSDTQLLMEVLNVLHRVILTSRHSETHLLAFRIALSLTTGLKLSEREDKIEEDKSCAYTLLVLASWALLKPSSNKELMSLAVQLLPNAVQWICPTVIHTVLPSVLYIMLSTITNLQGTWYMYTHYVQTESIPLTLNLAFGNLRVHIKCIF